ncbi:hypothetical protein KFE98_14340 [bacterium SCSIO 12741]|nr:hypothetical protein KFE98_14340 [bacterium SCSIO 12741]
MQFKQMVSWFWLFAFFGVMSYNVSVFSYYFWNQEKIAQEECVNLDRGITQCQGMCYLADQVVESIPTVESDLNVIIPGQLSFLFYFLPSSEDAVATTVYEYVAFLPVSEEELDGFTDIFIPPPSLA